MTPAEWWTAALILAAGFIGLYWWTSGDDTPIGDTARTEAIARADAYRMHPSQGDPFPEIAIAQLQCKHCRQTLMEVPTTGADLEDVLIAVRHQWAAAIADHKRTSHGVAA